MKNFIPLQEIADEIDLGSSGATVYLNLKTGKTVYVSDMSMTEEEKEAAIAEEGGEGNLIALPHVESHEGYRWMAEFTSTVTDARLSGMLDVALNGRGAFRRFRDVLQGFPQEREGWSDFKSAKLLALAREWARENKIPLAEKPIKHSE